jgi:hypothetical protein
MDASEQVSILANAFSEGINYVAYIRSLHADPPAISAEELLEWRKALDDFQDSLKTLQGGVPGYVVETSLKVSSDLVHCIENVRAHLSTITPGTQLPTSLFDLVDVAWTEVVKAMRSS